jgi:RNA polymerase sigma factor (sigma-70 family)
VADAADPVAPRRPGHSEAALITAARSGDVEAFGILVRRYQGIALKAATYHGAGSEAEDVVQDAFISAWRALPRFVEDRPLRPWIVKIVATEVRDRRRTGARRQGILHKFARGIAGADAASSAELIEHTEARVLLISALDRLPSNQRIVVVYRYLLELSERETADALGWPRGSVKSRLARALSRLRDDPTLDGLLDGDGHA